MAKNDVVLLDAILNSLAVPAGALPPDRGNQFERFVLDQVLKGYDLSDDEIACGWVDGWGDGGIDGFYVFVNGRPVVDLADFAWPRSDASLEVYLFTCRHRDAFKQEPLDAMLASLHELLDLGKPQEDLAGAYSAKVLGARARLDAAFRTLSLSRPRMRFHLVYASRGDAQERFDTITARGVQLEKLVLSYFSNARARFALLGASELVEMYRQAKTFSLTLTFTEHLAASQDGYVVLAPLDAYRQFVTDEQGHLRRYLFDSNVRDFLGRNRVNSDILATLRNPEAPNFWWLNNGVTILASGANVVGKQLQMRDIQIVNGLQTTESIFLHFLADRDGRAEDAPRFVLIKIIVTNDERVRDQVIRATNNQTAVDAAALHATDKIQHDIEQVLNEHGLFYERRTNYFKNAGKPAASIVTPALLAAGVASLVFKNPVKSGMKRRLAANPSVYAATFSEKHPIRMWPALVACLRQAEVAISDEAQRSETMVLGLPTNWRGVVAFITVARHFGTVHFHTEQLAGLPENIPAAEAFQEVAAFVLARRKKVAATFEAVRDIIIEASATYGIEGNWLHARRVFSANIPKNDRGLAHSIKPELLETIDAALPPQPWPRHVHTQVAEKLALSKAFVRKAIQELIRQGRRDDQVEGKVIQRSHDSNDA